MKRRRFTSEFKLQCVLDILSGRKIPAQICRENNVSESALCRWRQQFIERAPKIFENGSSAKSAEAQRSLRFDMKHRNRLSFGSACVKMSISYNRGVLS